MFLMSYGYNPSSQKPVQPQAPSKAIPPISPTPNLNNNQLPQNFIKNDPQTISSIMKKTVLNHIQTLKKRAELTNNFAKKQNLPYRLKVYSNNSVTLLDVILINENNEELEKITHNITKENFNKIIDNISEGSGLFFDS
jgi:hypothetical protein